jgi:hypothetical protein
MGGSRSYHSLATGPHVNAPKEERFPQSPFIGAITTHTHFIDNIVRVALNYQFHRSDYGFRKNSLAMSAYGTKRTSKRRPAMSAFG